MSSIRRQSIISSIVIYIGFIIGLFNIYLFTKGSPRLFEDSQYGLYNAFIAISTMMMAFASLGMPSYIYKFFPYYKEHLPDKKNDQLSIALVVALIGFVLVVVAGIAFKDLVVKKYSEHAEELVSFYEWIFPLGFGLLIFTVLEAYAWQLHRSIVTNFLKEVAWRLFITVDMALYAFHYIDFGSFIKLFSFSYLFIALSLFGYLLATKNIHFTLNISKVTRRFVGAIRKLCSFVYAGVLILSLSLVFDSLVISSVLTDALTQLAVYSAAQNVAAIIQAPQRGIIAASVAHLSKAWKDKNLPLIQKIYQRSSVNQLIFSCGLLALIILSFTDAVYTFHLKGTYLDAYYVVILLGLTKVVDMGTGVNAQIIATSTYWKFELISGVILLTVMLPLSYLLTKEYGIVGTAIAQLISMSIYNIVRIVFLWKKFKLFPFTIHTVYTIALAGLCFAACYFGLRDVHGWGGMFLRSILFIVLYAVGGVYMKLSPDIQPVLQTIKKRLGLWKA